MIKKLTALILIISMFPVAYSISHAETESNYKQAVEVLDTFGLFDTFEGKSFFTMHKPNAPATAERPIILPFKEEGCQLLLNE